MKRIVVVFLLICTASMAQADEARLLRFPDIHENMVVFSYAGDLWTVDINDGVARRLTTHPGYESRAKFSPDGSMIAFTGAYDGNQDVFVMPSRGGEPKRLTYDPSGEIVVDWHPDGRHVYFRSSRNSPVPKYNRLFKVSIEGTHPEMIALPQVETSAINADASKLAFNRMRREHRTWKRYRGGLAPEIWVYDFTKNISENLTNNPANDHQPMWHGDMIYFVSDRDEAEDGRLKFQLYSLDPATKVVTRLTNMPEYDVLYPSIGGDTIVFENGGFLYTYDIPSGETSKLTVELYDDRRFARDTIKNVSGYIHSSDISPTGARAVFEARGELFTVPAEKGEIRQLTDTPGVRERNPVWSPDGQWIAYFGDETGEFQIYILKADGTGEPTRITEGLKTYFSSLNWSPDSKKLGYSDVTNTYYVVDIESKEITKIYHSDNNGPGNFVSASWAPDSNWLTYTRPAASGFSIVYLYNLKEGKEYQVTDGLTLDRAPAFDPNGKYLYWVADRAYNPAFSAFEFNYIHINPSRIAVAPLKKDAESPFAAESDEEPVKEEEKEGEAAEEKQAENGNGEKKVEEDKGLEIDVEGLASRMVSLPIADATHVGIMATKAGPIYATNVQGQPGFTLSMFDMKSRKEETIISGIFSATLSADGSKILYSMGPNYGIIKAAPGQKPGSGKLDLSNLTATVDYQKEWKQVYWEAWRQARDWFYDRNLHGMDWKAIGDRYAVMLPYVSHRVDLNFLIGEMIGELNSSHTYRSGGETPDVPSMNTGLLGAWIEADESGYYQIKKIYDGENWNPGRLGPLSQPGLNVNPGDYVVAIQGEEIKAPENFHSRLVNTAGRTVRISINSVPSMEGAREIDVKPVSNDAQLRYMNWISENIKKVNEATDGKVGYIYVPDTAFGGMEWFNRLFYAQIHKDALVVDARWNSGGFIPDIYLERLARRLLNVWKTPYSSGFQTPNTAHFGPKVCLTNGWAGSGGDAFPYYFRELNLGPVIGERSWGGLIGISGNPPLMDNGSVSIADFAFVNVDGEFDVENMGVTPDIPVVNVPHEVVSGRDPQLEKGIEVALDLLSKQEKNPVPVMPDKNPIR